MQSRSESRGGDKKKFMSLPETKPQCPVLDQPLHSHDDDDDDTTMKVVVLMKPIPSSKLNRAVKMMKFGFLVALHIKIMHYGE
jgi:hypothetical protein